MFINLDYPHQAGDKYLWLKNHPEINKHFDLEVYKNSNKVVYFIKRVNDQKASTAAADQQAIRPIFKKVFDYYYWKEFVRDIEAQLKDIEENWSEYLDGTRE